MDPLAWRLFATLARPGPPQLSGLLGTRGPDPGAPGSPGSSGTRAAGTTGRSSLEKTRPRLRGGLSRGLSFPVRPWGNDPGVCTPERRTSAWRASGIDASGLRVRLVLGLGWFAVRGAPAIRPKRIREPEPNARPWALFIG